MEYYWNSKTKRLEKRDLRANSNLNKVDKNKFQKFEKLNEKTKVLNTINTNYINSIQLGEYSLQDELASISKGPEEMKIGKASSPKRFKFSEKRVEMKHKRVQSMTPMSQASSVLDQS